MNEKYHKINDILVEYECRTNKSDGSKLMTACDALYVSASGTKHFYETLQLLSEINPAYKEEFEELKKKYD